MGVDALQSTFEHKLKTLTEFVRDSSSNNDDTDDGDTDGLSDEERLQLAYENAQNNEKVREQFISEPSQVFSQWHRSLGSEYTTIDIDWVESDDDGDVYLIYEAICVKKRPLTEDNINEYYSVWSYKRKAYEWLDDKLDCPVYVVWHTEECDHFFVREISPDAPLQELNGEQEFKDWLDEFRLDRNVPGDDTQKAISGAPSSVQGDTQPSDPSPNRGVSDFI